MFRPRQLLFINPDKIPVPGSGVVAPVVLVSSNLPTRAPLEDNSVTLLPL